MEVLRLDDPRAFLEVARPLLASDRAAEARHNLMLGIAGTAAAQPWLYPSFRAWVALRGREPVAAATRTPPFNAVLADPPTPDALEALVDAMIQADPDAPGLVGNVPHVHRAARRWAERAGVEARTVQRQGVYALTEVNDVPAAAGSSRPATESDRDLVLGWLYAFASEATAGMPNEPGLMERMLEARLATSDAGYRIWEDGGDAVGLAGYGSPTPSGIRIGPVYTPPERRRRGYATTLVAELAGWLLRRGHRACFLYADLANPTSNSIYAKIGYRRVCDSAEIRFGPGSGLRHGGREA